MATTSPHDLTIRRLRGGDLDRIFDVRTRAGGAESLARQRRAEVHVAVAELGGVPVGRAGLDFARFSLERAAYLWAAHVEPEHRSHGIGSSILRHLEEVAAGRGCTSVRLAVGKENTRALRLYERLGYVVDGEELQRWSYEDDGRIVGVVEDCWTMAKQIGARQGAPLAAARLPAPFRWRRPRRGRRGAG